MLQLADQINTHTQGGNLCTTPSAEIHCGLKKESKVKIWYLGTTCEEFREAFSSYFPTTLDYHQLYRGFIQTQGKSCTKLQPVPQSAAKQCQKHPCRALV